MNRPSRRKGDATSPLIDLDQKDEWEPVPEEGRIVFVSILMLVISLCAWFFL
jgi:hypothetical protein